MALDAGQVFVQLGGRFSPAGFTAFGSAIARARTDMERSEKAMTASQARMSRASAVLGTAAKTGAAAGIAAIGIAAYKSVKLAASFEAQLSSLKSVSGATGRQMQAFKKQAMDAGAATKFSALEAAAAQTELAKGGLSVTQIMRGGLKAALALAAAGELDLADAANTTANAMNLFGLHGKDATHIADALATAANATTVDVGDFAQALTQGGAAAKAAGLSFDETIAALEVLAAKGVKGSDAGTSLKTALTQIASPTKKSAEAMKQLGLDFFDAHGNMKPLVDVSAMLRDKLGGLTREQRLQAVSTIAGTDGMRTLLSLYEVGPQKVKGFETGLKKQGTAAEVAKEKQDNLKGSAENLQGSLETLGIRVGQTLTPALKDGADAATKFLNDLQAGKGDSGKAFDEISQAAHDMKPALDVVAGIGGDVFGGMVQSIAGVARAVGGVVHTISALIHGDLSGAVDGIKDVFGGLGEAVGGAVRQITAPFRAIAPALEGPFREAVDTILGLFSTMLGTVADVVGKLSGLPIIGGKFKGLADGIRDTAASIDTLREKVRGVPDKTVKIKPEGLDKVLSDLQQLGHVKVPDKTLKILGSSKDAEEKVRLLKQLNLPQKVQKILGSNLDAVAKIRAVRAELAALRDRVVHLRVERQFHTTTTVETKRGHAAGRGAGSAEAALVGEGGAPEWVVSPKAGSAYRTDGPMIVGLTPDEYVVPTEQRYRGRALGLIAGLAADLGLGAFAKGRKPKHFRPDTKAAGKKLAKLPVPEKVTYGAVSEELLSKRVDDERKAFKDRDSSIRDEEKKLRTADEKVRKAKRGKGKDAAKALRAARADRAKVAAHLHDLKYGGGEENLHSEQRLYEAWQRDRRDLIELRKVNATIERLNTEQQTDATRMQNASDAQDPAAYGAAQKHRAGLLERLKAMYEKAVKLAKPDSQLKADLDAKLQSVVGDLADAAKPYEVDETKETPAEKAAREAAEQLADTGMTAEERDQAVGLDAQEKLAALTAGLDDDRAAAAARVSFLQKILGEVQTDPARGGNATIASVAGLLKQAQDSAAALSGSTGSVDNPDLQAQLEQERERRRAAERAAVVANQAVAVFGGPGDIGTGGQTAFGAARPNITINTLHPGDPTTLRAIGDAAVGGMSLQPARTAPRERVL